MAVSTSDLIDQMLANTAVLTGAPVHNMSYRAGYLESTLKEILLRSPEAVNIIKERIAYQNSLIDRCKKNELDYC
jgi:hypothetical protein